MRPRIVFIGYKRVIDLAASLKLSGKPGVAFDIREGLLDSALAVAREVESRGGADVLMSSGANAAMIRPYISTPLVEVKITGFDLLLSLRKLDTSLPVAVITFKDRLRFLSEVAGLLTPKISQLTFQTVAELDVVLKQVLAQGITQVVGGSLVLERAQLYGIRSAFIYSSDGVLRAYEVAREMAIAHRRVLEHSSKLDAIIKFAHDGIIATDASGVISVFNPSAARISGVASEDALGCHVTDILPNTRMLEVMKTGRQELGQIQKLQGVNIVTNRIPMLDKKGKNLGCVVTFQDARAIQTAEAKIRRLAGKAFKARVRMEHILGQSESITSARVQAARFARSDSSVLIVGETGAGKEYFAQGIHLDSARASQAFVGTNCAALPSDLLESELFGYAEGAFTGAKRGGRAGLFEIAHKGTIFLDEISEIPLAIQGRLLRVLQEREVMRIGDEQVIAVDIRVIAATNRNLWEMTQRGLFRQDLYYRLCVLRLHLPPLRERLADIPPLIDHFLDDLAVDMTRKQRRELAMHPRLYQHSWPGNIRELRNLVECVAVLHKEGAGLGQLLEEFMAPERGFLPRQDPLPGPKQEGDSFGKHGGKRLSKEELARSLGISRTTLWRKMRG